jgi:hypothetical protein
MRDEWRRCDEHSDGHFHSLVVTRGRKHAVLATVNAIADDWRDSPRATTSPLMLSLHPLPIGCRVIWLV